MLFCRVTRVSTSTSCATGRWRFSRAAWSSPFLVRIKTYILAFHSNLIYVLKVKHLLWNIAVCHGHRILGDLATMVKASTASLHTNTHTHTHTHTDIILTSVFGLLPGKGDLFGSDLSDDEVTVQSSCDVKSLTYCDLQCILLKSLKDTLIQYPEFQETFHEEIKHDLTYNLKEGFEEGEVSDHRNTTSVHCEQNTATGQRNEFSSSQTESQNLQRTIPRCFEFFR